MKFLKIFLLTIFFFPISFQAKSSEESIKKIKIGILFKGNNMDDYRGALAYFNQYNENSNNIKFEIYTYRTGDEGEYEIDTLKYLIDEKEVEYIFSPLLTKSESLDYIKKKNIPLIFMDNRSDVIEEYNKTEYPKLGIDTESEKNIILKHLNSSKHKEIEENIENIRPKKIAIVCPISLVPKVEKEIVDLIDKEIETSIIEYNANPLRINGAFLKTKEYNPDQILFIGDELINFTNKMARSSLKEKELIFFNKDSKDRALEILKEKGLKFTRIEYLPDINELNPLVLKYKEAIKKNYPYHQYKPSSFAYYCKANIFVHIIENMAQNSSNNKEKFLQYLSDLENIVIEDQVFIFQSGKYIKWEPRK